jgi:hypothetical protein
MSKGNRKLNPKDAKAMIMKLQGKDNPTIAKALGHKNNSPACASAMISRRIKRAKESEGFQALMNRLGATDEKIVNTALAALEAKDTKIASYNGMITDTMEVTDHGMRLKAAELLGRWKGIDKAPAPEEKPMELKVTLTVEKSNKDA